MRKTRTTNRNRLIVIGLITGIIAFYTFFSGGLNIRTAKVIRTESGHNMVLMDNSPVITADHTPRGNAFKNYSTGDEILMICGPVAESLPGQTVLHWCVKLNGGSYADIPADVLAMLRETGYTVIEETAQ